MLTSLGVFAGAALQDARAELAQSVRRAMNEDAADGQDALGARTIVYGKNRQSLSRPASHFPYDEGGDAAS